jgi:ligand-binding sensor domain-containing protein/signal transduction histidine kinase
VQFLEKTRRISTAAVRRAQALLFGGLLLAAVLPADAARVPPEAVRFENYGVEQGLSYGRVRAIAQDGAGYIWIATRDGLNRFDGERFRVYRHDPTDARSLPDNVVMALATTPDGTLWTGMAGGGLARYDPARDDFTRFQAGDGSGLAGNYVRTVQAGPDGQLWLGIFGVTVQQFDPRSGRARDLPLGRPPQLNGVHRMFFRGRGEVVFAGPDLSYWDGSSGQLRSLTAGLPAGVVPVPEESLLDRHDTVWVALTDGGLLRLGLDGGVVARYRSGPGEKLRGGDARRPFETRSGDIWIAMQNGVARFDPDSDSFIQNRHDPADPSSPPRDARVMLEDSAGLIWLGSELYGVSLHDPRSQAVAVYRDSQEDPRSLPGSLVQAVLSLPDGNHWLGLGSGGGLVLFRPGTGVLRHFRHDPADPGSLAGDTIASLALGRDGSLWVGTDGDGLDRLDPGATRFRHYREGNSEVLAPPVKRINALLVDAQDTLWVATDGGGVVSLCQGCAGFQSYQLGADDPFDLPRSTGTGIVQALDRSLWIGLFGGGVLRLDPASGALRRFPAATDGKGPRNSVVRTLLAARDGSLWAGSSDGLDRIVREPGGKVLFQPQPPPEGEVTHSVTCLAEDETGQIWIGTTSGLLRLDPRAGLPPRRMRLLNDLDRRGYAPGGCQSTLGRLFLGSAAGLVVFSPSTLQPPPPLGPVVLQTLLLANQPVRPQPGQPGALLQRTLAHTAGLNLDYSQDVFGFDFTALDYRFGERAAFRYRLDGLHKDWLPLRPGERSVTFTGVPAGDYRFRVQALREGSDVRETGIDLHIAPPPWRSAWAYGGYLLAGLAAALLYWRSRRHLRGVHQAVARLLERNAGLEDRLSRHGAELSRSNDARQAALDLLQRVQARLVDAQRLASLGGVAAAIAAETRAPLQACLNAAADLQQQTNLLLQRLTQRDLRRSELDYFRDIASSGSSLILSNLHSAEQLLRGLQAAADPSGDTARRLDLEQCMRDALLLLGPVLRATPHRVLFECPQPVVIHAPPGALQQIVSSLVLRAVHYGFAADAAGTVSVRVEADGGRVRLRVCDDGSGMDAQERAAIFDPLSGARGDAISLYTVHALVERVLHGSIECSAQPGGGTCFDIHWAARTH